MLTLADAAMLVAAGPVDAGAAGRWGDGGGGRRRRRRDALLLGEGVGIAAINAPTSVVISGAQDTVNAIADRFAGAGQASAPLAVSHAFHSP